MSNAVLHRAQDASRFIQYYRTAIESSPLQVYYSPLIFSPKATLTRRCHQKERPGWVLNDPVVEEDWNPCLQTLEGHSDFVNSIAWSQDGSRLASKSRDKEVKIWDLATGQCASTFHVSSSDFLQFNHLYSGSNSSMEFVTSNGYGLSDDKSWITFDGVKLLWLPAEYRPYDTNAFAIHANKLAIGCPSGRVIFLTLAEQDPIAAY